MTSLTDESYISSDDNLGVPLLLQNYSFDNESNNIGLGTIVNADIGCSNSRPLSYIVGTQVITNTDIEPSVNPQNCNDSFETPENPLEIGDPSVNPQNCIGSFETPEFPLVTGEPNPYLVLSDYRAKHLNRIIIAHININSIRNKFDMLVDMINGKIDIILVSETKINDSFPSSQFLISGYSAHLSSLTVQILGVDLCFLLGKTSLLNLCRLLYYLLIMNVFLLKLISTKRNG